MTHGEQNPMEILRDMSPEGARTYRSDVIPSLQRPVHDDRHAKDAEHRADDVGPVWLRSIEPPAPQERQHYEHTTVRRVHAAKMCRLKRRYDAVQEEDQATDRAEEKCPPFAEPQPDEVAAADFQ